MYYSRRAIRVYWLALVLSLVAVATPVSGIPQDAPLDTGDNWNVTLVGRWPCGPSYDAAVRNDTVYAGNGGCIDIVDFTAPAGPVHVSRLAL
ncbi:MAG: hypothetical protein JSW50_10585, partial [Candidatus Latescibacterota bacterium]